MQIPTAVGVFIAELRGPIDGPLRHWISEFSPGSLAGDIKILRETTED